ncbi:hypothetical protein B0O99DRAFT_699474 [Bisporella sp. PMI_857]|nr:hypothetical protein B0O99DRAFT_699474 [Bisporella sp. PMI_857]
MRLPSIVLVASLHAVAINAAAIALEHVLGDHDAPARRSNFQVPDPPEPEPIIVTELPLPPVAPSDDVGSCSAEINPRGTGCIAKIRASFQTGNFLPDSLHIVVVMNFTGAPAAPDPASVYNGVQLSIVKIDGATFPNGDAWKCITCGVPAINQVGRNSAMDYPQAFWDGSRVLVGLNIVDCGIFQLSSPQCTPETTYIYPLRWNNNVDGSGAGGSIRELRLHPDGVHLGFNSITVFNGKMGQYGYFSRLQFNPEPTTGTPLSPRYDLVNVTRLFNPEILQPISVEGNGTQLRVNSQAISIGELRGFSGRGTEVTYVGTPVESSNIDVFAADLTTGAVRRLTSNPEYVDPVDISPDDQWTVVDDTRGTNRQMFIAGMRNIPPITDIVSTTVTSSTRNNGDRRFFEVFLIDRYGDRGLYQGQKVNGEGDGSPGSVNDPYWNAMADPKWSHDGTRIAFFQALTVAPACGGENPLPCPISTAQGGREYRAMIAYLASRAPITQLPVAPVSDTVPWGVPYVAGSTAPARPFPPEGLYTLAGGITGSANINITWDASKRSPQTVAVEYNNFSYDGITILSGTEEVSVSNPSPTLNHIDWFSDLRSIGERGIISTKKTSEDGFHLDIDVLINDFSATGTMTTTVDGIAYEQPMNGT